MTGAVQIFGDRPAVRFTARRGVSSRRRSAMFAAFAPLVVQWLVRPPPSVDRSEMPPVGCNARSVGDHRVRSLPQLQGAIYDACSLA